MEWSTSACRTDSTDPSAERFYSRAVVAPPGALSRQFERRRVRKTYWAVVEGQIAETQGRWTDHVRKIPHEAQAEIVASDHPDAEEALLDYRVLGECKAGTWLEIELGTGRYHQIRIQAAARGLPILGDGLYGSQRSFGPQYEDQRLRAIALHARRLGFFHPVTKEPAVVTADLPHAWAALGPPPVVAAADESPA